MDKGFSLESGNGCQLLKVRGKLIADYYVLSFPCNQGEPCSDEEAELLGVGLVQARKLALKQIDDAEAFSVLYSGYSTRRHRGWHLHIVLLGNRWRKAWLYFVLCGKNVLQAFGLRKDDAPRLA